MARALIEAGADVEASTGAATDSTKSHTPLSIAAILGRADVVRALIAAGADVDHLDSRYSPIRWAASPYWLRINTWDISADSADIAHALIAAGASAPGSTWSTRNLFFRSLDHTSVNLLSLEKISNLFIKDSNELAWGIYAPTGALLPASYLDVMRVLIEAGSRGSHISARNYARWLSQTKSADVMRVLSKHVANRSPVRTLANYSDEIIFYAQSAGIARLALENGAEEKYRALTGDLHRGLNPLHTAATEGVARVLIAAGADVSATARIYESELLPLDSRLQCVAGITPLHTAATAGVARVLIAAGADITSIDHEPDSHCTAINAKEGAWRWQYVYGGHRNTPLHTAATAGVARALIEAGAEIRATTSNGNTPLHTAATAGVARVLLAAGADVNAIRDNGATPLHIAARAGHADVARVLIWRQADVNATQFNGATALHIAAWEGHADVARVLIEKQADVNAANNPGSTPLHNAAWQGHAGVVRALLAAGAEVNVTDNSCTTPLGHAERHGHTAVVEMLRRAGARDNVLCER